MAETRKNLLQWGERTEAEAAWGILETYMKEFTPRLQGGERVMLHAMMLAGRHLERFSQEQCHKALDFFQTWKDAYPNDLFESQCRYIMALLSAELFVRAKKKDEADAFENDEKHPPVPEPMECPRDELFPEAVELVFASGEGSISALQKEFRISYGRAAEIVEQMEKAGLLSEYNGGSRELLMTRKQWEEKVNHSCSPD